MRGLAEEVPEKGQISARNSGSDIAGGIAQAYGKDLRCWWCSEKRIAEL